MYEPDDDETPDEEPATDPNDAVPPWGPGEDLNPGHG